MGRGTSAIRGIGEGILRGMEIRTNMDRAKSDDAYREEQRQALRDAAARETQHRQALSDAATPRSSIEGTAVPSATGDQNLYIDPVQAQAAAKDAQIEAEMRGQAPLAAPQKAYGVVGPSLGNQITTQQPDIAAMNTPKAQLGRVVDAEMRFDPAKALSLKNAGLQGDKAQMEMDDMQRRRRAEIEAEGMVPAVRAAQTGDAAAVVEAFNKQGKFKVDGELKVEKVQREAPWGAKVDTYTYTGTVVDADGNKKPVRLNSLDAMVQMMPYKDLFETQVKAGEVGRKHELTLAEIAARGEGKDSSTKPPSGYRWSKDGNLEVIPGGPGEKTSGFNSMDRMLIDGRINAARQDLKAIDEKLADPLISMASEKSPNWARKQALLAQQAEAQGEYKKWSAALEQAASQSATKTLGGVKSTSSMSLKGNGGDTDRLAILTKELEKAVSKGSKADVEALQRELSRIPGGEKAVAGMSSAKASQKPVTVTSREERDALEPGTKYVAPDGQTYTKK